MQGLKVDNKKIAKNTAFLYIRMLFVLFVSLYTTRVVLQVLGVEDYGVYNVVGGFVSMFSFLNTSLVGAIQRYYNFESSMNGDEGTKKVYITSLFIQGFLSIVLLIALETFGVWYVNNVLVVPPDRLFVAKILFQCSVISLILVVMQVPYSAAVMSFEKMDFYALMGIIDVLLRLAIVIALPFIQYDKLVIYGLLIFSISVLDFVLYFTYAKNKFKALKFKFEFNGGLFKSMLSFTGWNVLGTFSGVLKGQGLNMLLNAFFGTVVNAARGVAYQIMTALQSFSINIVSAFRPQLVDSYAAENYDRTRNIMFAESKICYTLMYVLAVPLVLELDFVLSLWLGSNVPEYTKEFTVIVLAIMTVSTLNTPLTQTIHASGKLRAYMIATSIVTFAIVPVAWVALKLGFGPIAVFWVSFALTIINQIISVFIVRKVFPFSLKHYMSKVIIPCVVLTIILPFVPYLISNYFNSSIFRLCAVVVTDVIWATVVILLFILNKEERLLVKSYIQKLFSKR